MQKFEYKKFINLSDKYKDKVNKISTARMVVFIFMIIFFVLGSKNDFFNLIGILFTFLFVILIFIHDKYYKLLDYYNKYIVILEQYKARIDGNWRIFSDTGDDFGNDMLFDLDIVGKNSLFQYLSVCKTLGGRIKLVEKLSNKKISTKKIVSNQNAIEELCNDVNFDIDFQINMLNYGNKKINLEDYFEYLDNNVGKRYVDFVIGIIFCFLCLLMLLLGYLKIISYNYFYGLFIFNFLINFMYSYIYRKDFERISCVSDNYSNLNSIYACIIKRNFNSALLKKLQFDVIDSNDCIEKLVRINNLNNLKNNTLSSFIFNGFFCINILVMFIYSKFQENNISNLKKGIVAVEELESYISLAGIGLTKNEIFMPNIDDDIYLEFSQLKHPLLEEDKCVGNDFNGKNGVNIITGSNMGGKTSFLRTIGINLILMNAGTYVCAKSFKGCYLKIFTSMRVSDDIDKGISTFYGELLRIKQAMDYENGNRIILVDEIFKGTNYNDRIYGAVNVIKKLNDDKTILFITTHDFELCDVETNNLENYYVKEHYEGDNIKFDYKIRHGKCDSTNAKFLMKKLGIID